MADQPSLTLISLQVIEDGKSRIRSNRAELTLAWDGGTAPFIVRVLAKGHQELARQEIADGFRARLILPAGQIPVGTIHIIVADRVGDIVEKLVEVVPSASLPLRPAPLTLRDLPPELRAILTADYLIQTNRQRWGYEAYQELGPIADSYEPAKLFRDCLESIPSCYQP